MSQGLRVVVSGLIAQYALGGLTWDYINYLVGLQRLGHDVYYVEDTGQWPYNPRAGVVSQTCDDNIAHLVDALQPHGLQDRWAYHFPEDDEWYGMGDRDRRRVCATADVVLNVSGVLRDLEPFGSAGRLVYVDTDPAFTQVKVLRGQRDIERSIAAHDVRFTYGELLPGSELDTGHGWLPTRQPVVLDEWATNRPPGTSFTTVMNWSSYTSPEYEGVSYGQKDASFEPFLELPGRVPSVELELAVSEGKTTRTPRSLLRHHGWRLCDPAQRCADVDSYRDYLQGSLAEWSVAKAGYVVSQCGWFSDRSACYLAAGRPVILQDTGFSQTLPVGEGLLAFTDVDGAVAAIESVTSDTARHARAAREVAEACFDSDRVLSDLLDRAGGTTPGPTPSPPPAQP